MDAIEYLKEKMRMGCHVSPFEEENPDGAVQLVEEWSKANKPKTNAQKFEEVFGKPVVADQAGHRCAPWRADCLICECDECDEWWDEPFQAPDRGFTIVTEVSDEVIQMINKCEEKEPVGFWDAKEKERWNQMKD